MSKQHKARKRTRHKAAQAQAKPRRGEKSPKGEKREGK
jgi:hypothetical protein